MFLNVMIIDQCLSDINRLQGTNAEKVIKEEMFALNNEYFDVKSECSRKKPDLYGCLIFFKNVSPAWVEGVFSLAGCFTQLSPRPKQPTQKVPKPGKMKS